MGDNGSGSGSGSGSGGRQSRVAPFCHQDGEFGVDPNGTLKDKRRASAIASTNEKDKKDKKDKKEENEQKDQSEKRLRAERDGEGVGVLGNRPSMGGTTLKLACLTLESIQKNRVGPNPVGPNVDKKNPVGPGDGLVAKRVARFKHSTQQEVERRSESSKGRTGRDFPASGVPANRQGSAAKVSAASGSTGQFAKSDVRAPDVDAGLKTAPIKGKVDSKPAGGDDRDKVDSKSARVDDRGKVDSKPARGDDRGKSGTPVRSEDKVGVQSKGPASPFKSRSDAKIPDEKGIEIQDDRDVDTEHMPQVPPKKT